MCWAYVGGSIRAWVLRYDRPYQTEFARLELKNTVVSKRKLLQLVESKTVDGWDDPRMSTLCGLRRRGVPASALRRFCEQLGVRKAEAGGQSASRGGARADVPTRATGVGIDFPAVSLAAPWVRLVARTHCLFEADNARFPLPRRHR